MTLMLAIVVFLTTTLLNASALQAMALNDAWDSQEKRLRENASITSTSASDSGGGTNVTVLVENTGEVAVSDFDEMDLLVQYTTPPDATVVVRLPFVATGPGNNEWTVASISPDTFHPGIWDPGETATVSLRLVPPSKAGTYGTVAVVLTKGASDSAYFNN